MKVLRTTMHAGVMPPDTTIRARYQRGPHLRSGDIDGSCAPLSLWTALIVLGVVTRPQVICQKLTFTDDAFAETWLRSLDVWFAGATEEDHEVLLDTVSRYVRRSVCKGAMRKQIDFTIDSLRRGEVVLLGVERPGGRDGHWTLAVGLEEMVSGESSEVIGILCLDSSEPPPELLRYNARLELDVPKKRATYVRFHCVSGDARSMTIDCAISLSPRRLPRRGANQAATAKQPRTDSG